MGTKLLSGNPNAIVVDMASAVVCKPGDVIITNIGATSLGFPASNMAAHLTDLATVQEAVHDSFLGIALDGKVAGRASQVRVATEGVFSIPIAAAAAAPIGSWFGLYNDDGAHGPPLDQLAILVATANLAIGVLVKPTLATDTHAHIRIFSTKTIGGPQTPAV